MAPGFFEHGSTYSLFKKEPIWLKDCYDIKILPPLVLKNCMPCLLEIQFVDSKGQQERIILEKQDSRNLFRFDLQTDIRLKVKAPGYEAAPLELRVRGQYSKEVFSGKLHMKAER
jgi:hypothetical protein